MDFDATMLSIESLVTLGNVYSSFNEAMTSLSAQKRALEVITVDENNVVHVEAKAGFEGLYRQLTEGTYSSLNTFMMNMSDDEWAALTSELSASAMKAGSGLSDDIIFLMSS